MRAPFMRRELLPLREMRDVAVTIHELVGDRSLQQVEAEDLRRSALLWHFTEARSNPVIICGRSSTAVATRVSTSIFHVEPRISRSSSSSRSTSTASMRQD